MLHNGRDKAVNTNSNTQECCTMDEIRQLIQTVIHKNAAQWTENYTIMGSQMEECALIARQM